MRTTQIYWPKKKGIGSLVRSVTRPFREQLQLVCRSVITVVTEGSGPKTVSDEGRLRCLPFFHPGVPAYAPSWRSGAFRMARRKSEAPCRTHRDKHPEHPQPRAHPRLSFVHTCLTRFIRQHVIKVELWTHRAHRSRQLGTPQRPPTRPQSRSGFHVQRGGFAEKTRWVGRRQRLA